MATAPSWITFDKISGSGGTPEEVSVTAEELSGSYRSGTIEVTAGNTSKSVRVLQRRPVVTDIYFIQTLSSGEQQWGVSISSFAYIEGYYGDIPQYVEIPLSSKTGESQNIEVPLSNGDSSVEDYLFTLPAAYGPYNLQLGGDRITVWGEEGDYPIDGDVDTVRIFRKSVVLYCFTGPSSTSGGSLYPECNLRVGCNNLSSQPSGMVVHLEEKIKLRVTARSGSTVLYTKEVNTDLNSWESRIFDGNLDVQNTTGIYVELLENYYNTDITANPEYRTYIRGFVVNKEEMIINVSQTNHSSYATFTASTPYPVTSDLGITIYGEAGSAYDVHLSMWAGDTMSDSANMTLDEGNTTWDSYDVSPLSDVFYSYSITIN